MIRVDYGFYTDKYAGSMIPDEVAFKQPLMKANVCLNQYMRQEPGKSDIDIVKLCLCEVAELIYQDDKTRQEHDGRVIQSENTDGYSVTYAADKENDGMARRVDVEVYNTIRKYLSGTGLLYLGVCLNDHECGTYDF